MAAISIVKPKGSTATASSKKAPAAQTPKPTTTKRRVAPGITLVSTTEMQSYLKLAVYGESGVGKTRLIGTALQLDDMCDALFIDAEAGDTTLKTDQEISPYLNRLVTARVHDWKQFSRTYDFLKEHCKLRDRTDDEGEAKLRELQARYMTADPEDPVDPESIMEPWRFKTAMVDSLTEAEAFSMASAMGVSATGKLDEDVPKSEWDEIRQNRSNILRTMRQFRALPINVLVTAGRTLRDDIEKRTHMMPDVTGSLRERIPHFMDVVGYMIVVTKTVDDKKVSLRRMYVQPVGRWMAKCRFANYTHTHFDNPTIPGIYKAVGLAEGPVELTK